MVQVRSIGVWLLLWSTSVPAQSVSIDLTPRADLTLKLTADDQATASSLGAALAKSLGCKLSDVQEQARGGQGEFRAQCSGVFQRRGQVVDGQLKLAGFRQALIKAKIDDVEMDIGVPNAPYQRGAFPKSWERICNNGVIHHTATVEPRELPARAIHVATGYRTAELAMIFAPLPFTLFLAVILVAWLNRAASKAGQMDPRTLRLCYTRGVAWGLTGLFLLWVAIWAGISGAFAGDTDVWALFSVWNGGSILAGKFAAVFFYMCPTLLVAALSVWWRPKAVPHLRVLVPSLALIVPAYWTISAFQSLGSFDLLHVFSRLWIAVLCAMLFGFLMRRVRAEHATTLASGDAHDRLCALAARCGLQLYEIHVVPVGTGVMAEPLDVQYNALHISDVVMETLSPAELEAAEARRWSLPLRRYPDARMVPLFLVSLLIGMALSLAALVVINIPLAALQLLLKMHTPIASVQLLLPMAIFFAVPIARLLYRWMLRRADRKASALVGNGDVVNSAAARLAAMQAMPWKWGRAVVAPVDAAPVAAAAPATVPAASPHVPPETVLAPLFSSSWRKMIGNVKAEGTVLTMSIPPVAVAIAVRSGVIPVAARWPAYLAAMMFALLLHHRVAKLVDWWSYRKLQDKLADRMHVAPGEGVLFVGLSPEPRALVYDGNWDWDVGFLTLSAGRLDYQGEQARFTLRRDQVTGIRVGRGAPHWSDPQWIYLGWRDLASGRHGDIPLIVPSVRSAWRLSAQVRELHRSLLAWKSGDMRQGSGAATDFGLPAFTAAPGAPPPNQLPFMLTTIAVCGLGSSLVARFPIGSEATLYFALVWTGKVLLDLFGHRLANIPEAKTV